MSYLRTDHYGHERRPEYIRTVVGLVEARDPLDYGWWRPLVIVHTYAPLAGRTS
jgi:hypothetical protein